MPRKSVGKGGSSLSHRSDSSSSSGSSSGYHGSSNGNMSARNTDSEVLVLNYFFPFLREIGAFKFLFSIDPLRPRGLRRAPLRCLPVLPEGLHGAAGEGGWGER